MKCCRVASAYNRSRSATVATEMSVHVRPHGAPAASDVITRRPKEFEGGLVSIL